MSTKLPYPTDITPELRRENVREWLEALRSGRYRQGTGCLSQDGADCCLGVGCKIMAEKFDGISVWETDRGKLMFGDSTNIMPSVVKQLFGIRADAGEFTSLSGHFKALSELNDHGTPFPEIADIIESRPPGLFVDEEGAK